MPPPGLLPLNTPNVVPFQRPGPPAGGQPGTLAVPPGAMPPGGPPGGPGGPMQGGPPQPGQQLLAPPKLKLPLPNTSDYVGETPNVDYDAPLDVTELRKQFTDYVTIKQTEIVEARNALQYYHGTQYTKTQIDTLTSRGQVPIVYNRIGRKIDGLVGVLEKLRGDPKAYGRVQDDEHGAELATQCVRYALDQCRWPAQETELMRKGACTGIVVAELGIMAGDKDDPDIDIAAVDATTFFYDPRSLKLDFSDCRFMGVSKLMTEDEFNEMFPPEPDPETGETVSRWDEAFGTVDDLGQTPFDNDKYYLWSQGRTKLRLVEHWFRAKGDWHFCFYAGAHILQAGKSPFYDEKGRTISRYDAFAVHIDGLGEHYGFVRNLMGPQDAMNQHRTKSVWIMNTRQLKVNRRALGGDNPDIETLRKEAARSDGVLLYDGDSRDLEVLTQDSEFLKQTEYYQDAKSEIETFGPNPALASGQGPADVSGRSLAMQQQSGIAELGPFLSSWRAWKLRMYRKIWVQQQRNWTAERTLRVTNDQGAAQYVAVNKQAQDEFGRPILVNAIGQLDVDILVDEGPDSVNVMGDVNDTLLALAHNSVPVPPALIIETSSLPQSKKEELKQMLAQPDPAKVAEQQALLAKTSAQTDHLKAGALSATASAAHKMQMAQHETVKMHATRIDAAQQALQGVQGPGGGMQPGQNAQNSQGSQPGVDASTASGQQAPAPSAPPAMAPPAGSAQGMPMMPPQGPQGPPNGIAGGPPQVPPGYDAARVQAPNAGGARLAPDGQHYVYLPHDKGNWQRVVRQ